MIRIKGYNQRLEEDILLTIDGDGVILGLEKWDHIQPGSVRLILNKCDVGENLLFQDDETTEDGVEEAAYAITLIVSSILWVVLFALISLILW